MLLIHHLIFPLLSALAVYPASDRYKQAWLPEVRIIFSYHRLEQLEYILIFPKDLQNFEMKKSDQKLK